MLKVWNICRIRQMFEIEKPRISGNSARKSADNRSTTDSPQPTAACFSKIPRPISQYSITSSRFTARPALNRADWMRPFTSVRNAEYSGTSTTGFMVPKLTSAISSVEPFFSFCAALTSRSASALSTRPLLSQ